MPKTLDRFILRETISDSTAATVYRADEKLPGNNSRPVALKVLPPIDPKDEQTLQRFSDEVKILAQLSVHPHVVTIYAIGLTENYPWFAMEYSPTTAVTKMAELPVDPQEVVRLLRQVGEGLSEMHNLKPPLLHQDLKPENVLVDAFNNYKITDFSLASMAAARRTQGLATVRYAAPEMLSAEFGKVSPATDLYALGHMAYEMALGSREHMKQFPAVFEGNASRGEPPPNKWMMWHASANTRPAVLSEVLPSFPAGLSDLINRLMAKPQAQRYISAKDMLTDLAAVAGSRSAMSTPAAAPVAAPSAAQPAAASTSAAPVINVTPGIPATPVPPVTTPAAVLAATSRYWVRLRGKVSGPFDVATLQRQIRQGIVSRLHQVSTDNVNWKGASEVEGLYGSATV